MLQPLNPCILSALVQKGNDANCIYVDMAKQSLNEDTNLSSDMHVLLDCYSAFKARL